MRYYVLVAVLVAVTLSGCFGDDPLDPKSANAELIDEARATLGDDAALYSISGIEPREPIPAEETDGCGTIPAASDPGNGEPPVWGFLYGSKSTEEGLVIVKEESGKTLCKMEEPLNGFGDYQPLDSWTVTAPQAARTIADNVDDYEDQVKNADVVMELSQTPDGPVWFFVAFGESGFGEWMVHADTREFLEELTETPLPIETPQPAPIPESGQAEGSTTGAFVVVVAPEPAEFEIISDGHENLEIVVESEAPLAQLGESYSVRVTHPSGQEESFLVTNGETLPIEPDVGEYIVHLAPTAAVAADFTVDYCAYTDMHCDEGPVESEFIKPRTRMPLTG